MARNPAEPPKEGPSGHARWAGYLDWVRGDVIAGVLSLSYADQRVPRVPSGWTPIELLSHCLHMEQRWFVWGFLGEQVDDPWGDWNTDEPWLADDADETRPAARWQVADDVTAEQLAERLEAVGARTRAVLRDFPSDATAAPGGRFGREGDGDPPTLEWICFHVLAEYARHAGHLDIVVELGGS
jgi:uncharacterized damage-inducible protein DinB